MKSCHILVAIILSFLAVGFSANNSIAQNTDIDSRITNIESYLKDFEDRFQSFSNNIQSAFKSYEDEINEAINTTSENIQINTEKRITEVDHRSIVLNLNSTSFQRIDTNTGTFLISVKNHEIKDNSISLTLEIANPNYMDYQDASLKIFWGNKFIGGDISSYNNWRKSLKGSEFSYKGKLEKGSITSISTLLKPASITNDFYLECELAIKSIYIVPTNE